MTPFRCGCAMRQYAVGIGLRLTTVQFRVSMLMIPCTVEVMPLPDRVFPRPREFWQLAMVWAPIAVLALLGLAAWVTNAFEGSELVGKNASAAQAFFILGAICFPLGAFMLARAEFNRASAAASRDWPTAQGKVTKSEMKSRLTGHGMTYTLDFACDYAVGGRGYRLRDVQFGTGRVGSRKLIDGFAEKYPVGSSVAVRYDPDDPQTAVLESADEMARNNRGLALSIFTAVAVGVLIVAFRNSL
jgi:hypothetical protein